MGFQGRAVGEGSSPQDGEIGGVGDPLSEGGR